MDLSKEFRNMALAMFVGYKALSMNETPVACIVIDNRSDEIISIGYNYTNNSLNGTKHAEFIAMKRLVDQGVDFANVTMYVTVEPCIMCGSFLRQLGVAEVIFGCGNDRFGGNGTVLSVHDDANLPGKGYSSYGGIMRTEAIQLLRNFYIQENDSAPVPQVKKNKDIDSKSFPENNIVISKDDFVHKYGTERLFIYKDKTLELTPILNQGYLIKDMITLKDIETIPFLEQEMGPTDQRQVDEFFDLFFSIDKNCKVDFTNLASVYNSKKRHLEE
jgi:tRNA-specific adenosine deaminase 2